MPLAKGLRAPRETSAHINIQKPPIKTVIKDKHQSSKLIGCILAACALHATGMQARAGHEEKVIVPPAAPASPIDLLLDVEFANEYVTPRGMIVRDQGLTIEPLLLGFVNLYKGDGFINSAKFVGGMWNDIGSSAVSRQPPFGSSPKTHYTEIDPIAGISIGFAKHFTLDVTYTAFVEQILSIGTSNHLETKLTFDDSYLMKGFGFHPYVSYWQELTGKATDADVPQAVFGPSRHSGSHPQPGSSYYLEVGIDPSYTFANVLGGLKLEAPCRVLLPDERFYGNYYGSSSTVGLYELGVKGTVPLTFMPAAYGHWSVHAGFKYLNFVDDNLYHLNQFNAPGQPVRDTWQVYGGVSVFF